LRFGGRILDRVNEIKVNVRAFLASS